MPKNVLVWHLAMGDVLTSEMKTAREMLIEDVLGC